MKIAHKLERSRSIRFAPLGVASVLTLAAALSLASCVPQTYLDDAQVEGKHWQKEALENQKRVDELENENRRLRAQIEAGGAPRESSFSTEAIDERLKNLREILAQTGQNPDDVVKFSVDGGYVYRMKDSIVFDLGSAEVSAAGKKVLEEVAADISSKPFGKVYVRGHTDNTPIAKPETKAKFPNGNLQLSAERAVAVAAFLGNQGKLDDARVVVMGFGQHDPVAPNDSAANKQKNRRVDIFVADADNASPAKQ
ncbi:MAG: OmpA family protein [Planctomycetes bacterium]|nr:OmpA family protein [Planctomycetota bacterium]